jgi:uncharacterized protein
MSTSGPQEDYSPIRTVFDCNIFLQAMANPLGPAGACLNSVRVGEIALFLSRPILIELIDVAARPVLQQKLNLSASIVTNFIEQLLDFSKLIEIVPSVFIHSEDPKDSIYVDLAIACDANIIVTRDQHLLSLRNLEHADGKRFLEKYSSIEVFSPVELIRRINQK